MSVSPEHPTSPGTDQVSEQAAAPSPDSTPSSPPPPPGEVRLEASAEQAMEQAMEQATKAPPEEDASASAGDHDDVRRPKKTWGPRVVEGGREYRKGTVVSVGPEAVFLEFGPKELGLLERSALAEAELPSVGSEVEVVVDRFDTTESLYFCSLPGKVQKADWELLEKGQIVEARVTGFNKGGLELEVASHRAFMPASQIDVRRIEDMSPYVDQKLVCKVMRVDRSGRGNITLSRRQVLAGERKEKVKELRESLKEGDEIEGEVRKIMPFGAFVDMGGIDGLLHVSDISHDRAIKVEDKIKEGDTVRVKVLKLDWEHDRHSLGLKQLEPNPYEESLKEINEGDVVTGRVTKLMEFGAFVEVADGVEGLVHISELDWKRVNKTSDVVQPNTTVKVKVLKIDPDERKVSLSIKQAKDRPQQAAPRGRRRKGEGEADTRKAEEILKETPEFRRLRERAKQQEKKKEKRGAKEAGGLGSARGMGLGLGDLKL